MKHYSASSHSPAKWALYGAALGALAMYLGDPDRGRRRRALINDKVHSVSHKTSHAIDVTKRDLHNRAQGLRATASRILPKRGMADSTHDLTENIRHQFERAKSSMVRNNWSPSARAMALTGGSVLGLNGLSRRMPIAMLMVASGLALIARAIVNQPIRRMSGMDPIAQAIDLQKTIYIEASPEKVYDVWCRFENFPQFMSNVQQVDDLGNNRSHWVVRGPAGSRVEWDARTTESKRPEILAWISEPNATVRNSGTIRFKPEGSGTRVIVRLSYSPPAGVLGHAVAAMFGRDPKREMDEDLMRMKAFIETGITPHDAALSGQHFGSAAASAPHIPPTTTVH